MKIAELIQFLESHAPLSLQEDYDNSGFLVGDDQRELEKVLISLDVTEEVVEEAINEGAQLIVSHHPIIFSGLKQLTGKDYVQRTVIKALKNDIALYAIHTNLDNVSKDGVNSKIASKLALSNTFVLEENPNKHHGGQQIGAGMIGEMENPMDEKAFLDYLKERMELKVLKHTPLTGNKIKKVALCGGSGSFLLKSAIDNGADVFISADFKYHQYFDADGKILIADIGHYESEKYTSQLLLELLNGNFTNFAALISKIDTNPVNYY